MHLYVLARANLPRMERWVNDLLAQYYPYKFRKDFKNPNEPIMQGLLQMSVRPIQLYELVFPQDHLKDVLETVYPYHKTNPKMAFMLRKMLGLDPLPREWCKEGALKKNFRVMNHDMSVQFVGLKKDKFKHEIEFI